MLLKEIRDSASIERKPTNQDRLGAPLLDGVINRVLRALVLGVTRLLSKGKVQLPEHVLNVILIDVLGRAHTGDHHRSRVNRGALRVDGQSDRHGVFVAPQKGIRSLAGTTPSMLLPVRVPPPVSPVGRTES